MTTSGTSSYNSTRDIIIRRSLRMVGGYAADSNPTAPQINDANDVLNILLKEWQMDGMLWLKASGTVFLNKGQHQYLLAPSTYTGFSHVAVSSAPGATPYVQTTTTAALAIGASVIPVTSSTGITTG